MTSTPSSSAADGPLAAHGLACRRGRRLLFRGLQMSLDAGSITWLTGSNGSGKTSLMRILAGLSQPTEGEITWGGVARTRVGAQALRSLVYIGHSNALKDDLTLLEAVSFCATLAALDRPRERAGAALDAMGLRSRAEAPVRTLSQGQRRRGALARLRLDDAPRTWILDEPFDALDAASVVALRERIQSHARRGGAVLFTSHLPIKMSGTVEFDLEPFRAGA